MGCDIGTPADRPLDLESLRRREVQMMGAAISTRNWHDMESAYNQLRDKIDRELSRRARAAFSPTRNDEAARGGRSGKP